MSQLICTFDSMWGDAEMRKADRAMGALLGLACGDAVGTTLEFVAPGTFEPLTDMIGGGPFRLTAGQWTGDTSMALCLAESIIDCGGLDPVDHLRRYVLWADTGYLSSNGRCFDIGITTRTQLDRFRRTGDPFPIAVDEEAAANGSLMRLAPVPIRWHTDTALAAELSGDSSCTTHPATRPVDACRVLGAMVAALIDGAKPDEVFAADFWSWGEWHPAIESVVRGSWGTKEPPDIRGTGYCVDALEAALWAVGGADTFAEAVLRAANLGDDADTTAAIAGQLAGARWGASAIPDAWRARLARGERIESLATALFEAGTPTDSPRRWNHDDFIHAWLVDDGVLAGAYPGNPDPARANEKLNLLVDAGIRTFVDLTTPDDRLAPYDHQLAAMAARRDLDLQRLSYPIPDLGVVAIAVYDDIVNAIANARRRGGVYVHCWGGVGRTGTVVACWYGSRGDDLDAALDRLRAARAGTCKADRRAPESEAQHDLLAQRLGRTTGR